jgi:hypothetical protein
VGAGPVGGDFHVWLWLWLVVCSKCWDLSSWFYTLIDVQEKAIWMLHKKIKKAPLPMEPSYSS